MASRLYLLCGKMGAGKSTYALSLAQREQLLLISEDEWLSALFPDQIHSFEDYIAHSQALHSVMDKHIRSIAQLGVSIILDFPANTVAQRARYQALTKGIEVSTRLFYLERDDNKCLQQIAKRSIEQPQRSAFDTPQVFEQVTRYFQAPSASEGFEVVRV